MKIWIRIAGGVLLLLIGALWSLQGSGAIGGSGMSGKGQFLVIGLLVAVGGVVLLVGGVKKMRAGTRS
uniref:Integral membrane protein n=1 Tax=Streptomyces sp. NBC_00093 TaxID=2975649 RepID=A0AAU2AE48_9ACTN